MSKKCSETYTGDEERTASHEPTSLTLPKLATSSNTDFKTFLSYTCTALEHVSSFSVDIKTRLYDACLYFAPKHATSFIVDFETHSSNACIAPEYINSYNVEFKTHLADGCTPSEHKISFYVDVETGLSDALIAPEQY